MLKNVSFGFIGSGYMGEALIKGLITKGVVNKAHIISSDAAPERLRFIKELYGIRTTESNIEIIKSSDVIILAIKPQIMSKVLEEITPYVDNKKLIISIAAGIPMSLIQGYLKDARIIRVMPNNPAFIGEGAAAISSGKNTRLEDLNLAKEIFKSVGKVVAVEEELIDAVTGLSGSGPAYVFSFIDALIEGGILMGIPRDVAHTLAVQTVIGSAKMVFETGEKPSLLKERITSPGGTTIAGLFILERNGVKGSIMEAVKAATLRSKELGEIEKK